MNHTRSLLILSALLAVFLFSSCDTFDHPITEEPEFMKKDLTGVYEVIDPDDKPGTISDTLRVYMPYPGIYSLEYETMNVTDSTISSEITNIGVGHFSKFDRSLYFNLTTDGTWMYFKMNLKKEPILAAVVDLNNHREHMPHEDILNDLRNGDIELSDEMRLIRVSDLKIK